MVQPHITLDIVYHIMELLRDDPRTLKECCLVSKSWTHSCQIHLFYDVAIKIDSPQLLKKWGKTVRILDSGTSPACYVRSLKVDPTYLVTAEDGKVGGWIQPFANVVHLELPVVPIDEMWFKLPASNVSFTHFHTLSSVESLNLIFKTVSPSEQVLNLICSLPRLKDLVLIAQGSVIGGIEKVTSQPSPPPPLTGTLTLGEGVETVANILKYVPRGLHFRRIAFNASCGQNLACVTDLVEMCSNTLQYVECVHPKQKVESGKIDLSKAKKLREVSFIIKQANIAWAIGMVESITDQHRDLQKISIHFDTSFCIIIATASPQSRTNLDSNLPRLRKLLVNLARLRPSLVIHVEALCTETGRMCEYIHDRFMDEMFCT